MMIWALVIGACVAAPFLLVGLGALALNLRWGDGWAFLGGWSVAGLAVGLLVGGVCFGAFTVDSRACYRQGAELGVEVRWEVVGGCYARAGDRLVPVSWLVPVVEGERLRIEVVVPDR